MEGGLKIEVRSKIKPTAKWLMGGVLHGFWQKE
jgi:hypothetical protein